MHNSKAANALIELLSHSRFIIAYKGYDSEAIRDYIRARGSKLVISRKQNTKQGNDNIDWCLYKYRHLVENAFARLKHFRAIATRFDKLKINFESQLALACAIILAADVKDQHPLDH